MLNMKLNLIDEGLKSSDTVTISEHLLNRVKTNIPKIDKVLNGGFVKGQVFALIAEAGTGKTTMLLGALANMPNVKSAYLSGEECEEQLALNCQRIGVKVTIGNVKNIEKICQLIKKEKLERVILDSIPSLETTQKMKKVDAQRYIANTIVDVAKSTGCIIGCILHMTKGGVYKGGSEIMHTIDSEFYLKRDKTNPNIRILSSKKNRFGGSNIQEELLMTSKGFDFFFDPEKYKNIVVENLSSKVIKLLKSCENTLKYKDLLNFEESEEKSIFDILDELIVRFNGFKTGSIKNKDLLYYVCDIDIDKLSAKYTRQGYIFS